MMPFTVFLRRCQIQFTVYIFLISSLVFSFHFFRPSLIVILIANNSAYCYTYVMSEWLSNSVAVFRCPIVFSFSPVVSYKSFIRIYTYKHLPYHNPEESTYIKGL